MTQLVWTARAEGRLYSELDALREQSQTAAEARAKLVLEAADVLQRFPEAGLLLTDDNIRKYAVPEIDYVLLYRHLRDVVRILAFYHGREDWLSRYELL